MIVICLHANYLSTWFSLTSLTSLTRISQLFKTETMINPQRAMSMRRKRELEGRSWAAISMAAAKMSLTTASTPNRTSLYEIHAVSFVVSCCIKHLLGS